MVSVMKLEKAPVETYADVGGLAEQIEEIHETVGTIGYWLIGLHAAASLFHHYVQRDNTLARMWMRRSTTGG